jgi:hypothetical protein
MAWTWKLVLFYVVTYTWLTLLVVKEWIDLKLLEKG